MGYGLVDAMYQGIPKLGWQNVVIGDPLTTIAWGKQTLTQNLTWSSTNLVTGKITVPSGKTLTIASNAVINFKHLGALDIQTGGSLVIQSGALLNINAGNTFEFSNSLTIPSGATLNITSGATIKFATGTSLIVNGTLNANQVTFTRSGTSGSWNGIVFNQGSSGTIQNCNISYASTGITCNYSLPNINNNTIEDNSTSTSLYNLGSSSVELTGNTIQNNSYQGFYLSYSSPRIYSNTILNNGSLGINCYNSSPILVGNTITGHTYSGLRCHNYSSPHLATWGGGVYWGPGHNVIINNTGTGVSASYNSNLFLGGYPYGGYNSIFSNSNCSISAYYGCNIMAEINWWGAYPPNSSEFYSYQSSIDYTPALSSDPNLGMQKVAILESNSIPSSVEITSAETELAIAFKYQLEGKFDEAITIYADFINKNFDNP